MIYTPLVSIITPVLNGVKYLEPCIESVLHQSYPYIEHVFIDGASTDGTVDVLSKYSASYPGRVRFLSEPDGNVGEALDKAIPMSKGEILGHLGSDDMLEPGAIEKAVGFFRANPDAHFVYGDCNFINDKGEVVKRYYCSEFNLKRLINDKFLIWICTSFIKRGVFEKIGLFNVSKEAAIVNDFDFFIRAGEAFQIQHIAEVFSNFRLREISLTGKLWEAESERIKDLYIVSRRHGGRRFGGYFRRYFLCLAVDWLRPILHPIYPFIARMYNKHKCKKGSLFATWLG